MITNNHVGQYVLVRNCTDDAWKKRILARVVENREDTDRPYLCYGKDKSAYHGPQVYAWTYCKGVNEATYRDVGEDDVGLTVEVSADGQCWKRKRLVAIDDSNHRQYVTANDQNNGGWFWKFARVCDE